MDAARRRRAREVDVLSLRSRDRRCGPTVARTDELAPAGVVVFVVTGNSADDSSAVPPARTRPTIAVAATDRRNRMYALSKGGSCADILGPGKRVLGVWGGRGNREYRGRREPRSRG